MNQDPLLARDRQSQAIYGGVEVEHQGWGVQLLEAGAEEPLGGVGV
jgi:hypothetical protein